MLLRCNCESMSCTHTKKGRSCSTTVRVTSEVECDWMLYVGVICKQCAKDVAAGGGDHYLTKITETELDLDLLRPQKRHRD
jgi:hypothetical protein